ncbi:PAS domain-containing sensor histidine kinase [Telluribacter sp. SYSU D00476]|uniref:PAS domain-containing sensor histidine kinase n=1 Tax=Telluribacter sp. SYSU D00476 TaxID=2811430 RepID=UPI001FF492D6|nr:PAS domain-containing sensor histidine kinase [Telluribacter sp. SYSU D00476]
MLLFWGKEQFCFLNDAYYARRPVSIGSSAVDLCPDLVPLLEQVLTTGTAVQSQEDLLGWSKLLIPAGKISFSYSPVFGDTGKPAGALVTCTETIQAEPETMGTGGMAQELILDNLSAHIAVLDPKGNIITVNEAWRKFSADNGGPTTGFVGSNYLLICRQSGEDEAIQIAEGIDKVLRGKLTEFTLDYPCHSPTQQRWFRARVTPVLADGLITQVVVKHQDITEKEKNWLLTQKALQEKQNILDASLDMICTIDPEGRFIQVSRACRNILGYDPEELQGVTFLNLVSKQDQVKTIRATERLVAGEQLYNFENSYVRKDGSLVPMAWSARWEAKEEVFYCVARDNTERKRIEEQLNLQEQKTRTILESITDGFGVLDKEWKITYCNPEAERILGITEETAVGTSIWDIFPEAISLKFYSEYQRALVEQEPVHFEEYLPSIQAWLEVTAYPSEDGLSIYFKDVTERIKDKQALELSEQRFKALVQEGVDMIGILDQEGNVTYVSPTIEQILGIPVEFLIGKNVFDFIHEEDREWVFQYFLLLGSVKQMKLDPFRFLDAQQKYRWIETVATDLLDSPAVGGIVVNARDITQRIQQAQEREDLIRELTLTNNDLRQFTFITSHNFRAPLSNLIGLLDLMQDIPVENPLLAELITGLQTSTNALNNTINDLTDILIIKSSHSKSGEPIRLREVFDKITNQLSIALVEAQADVSFDDTQVPVVNYDRSYIESIFLNLLSNSIKYRSYDRKLKISITTREIENGIQLVFSDNGIGIDLKRYGNRLFGLYQRFHDRPNSKGFGLYLIKSQIESLGGSIQVESKVNEGTSFIITFKKQ